MKLWYHIVTVSLCPPHPPNHYYYLYIVVPAAPSITLMSKSDTSQCNSSILIEGGDKTTIAFKISGSNASYRFDGAYSPKICFTSSDGAEFAVSHFLLYCKLIFLIAYTVPTLFAFDQCLTSNTFSDSNLVSLAIQVSLNSPCLL